MFQVLFGLMLTVALFSACEGPAGAKGDKGDTGANGANGQDATVKCTQCHGDADVNLKFAQYEISRHGTGIIFEEEAGRIQCGGCHTGGGFVEAATAGVNDPTYSATGKISCQTCHTIHTAYDTTDFALRINAPVKLRIGGEVVDFKTGNLCAKCHQGRSYTHNLGDNDTVNAGATTTYSRFGPHYGVIANVYAWKGLEPVIGFTPDINPHFGLPQGCVSCHMGRDTANPASGGHTFVMTTANLANSDAQTKSQTCSCHSKTQLLAGAVAKLVKADLVKIRRFLIDKKYLDTTQALGSDGTYNVLGEYFYAPKGGTKIAIRKDTSAVILNYLYLAKEKSNGAHNPANTKAMLIAMKAFLGIQ
jgi:hypothetical protein